MLKKNALCASVALTAFVAALSFSLVACGDDSTSAKDETPTSSSENDGMPSSSSVMETSEIECNVENEGIYKTLKDTLTVYEDGNAMVWNKYYHCETGEWVETECRDPQDACTGDNEGEDRDVICFAQPGNPKAPTTHWTFMCRNNKWEKLSDEEKSQLDAEKKRAEVEIICNDQTKPEAKLGDVCGISEQGGNVSFGVVTYTLVCYVYTEDGWVAKGAGAPTENGCDDILGAVVDTVAAE